MEEIIIDKERVNKVLNNIIDDEKMFELAAYITKSTQSAISHQLKLLKDSNLIKSRKEGKVVYYSLDDDHVEKILEKGLEHIEEI